MVTEYFKCPQCGTKSTVKKIIKDNYACPNPNCELHVRLLVHGEVNTAGEVNKVYGWVLESGKVLKKKYKIVKMVGKGGFGATYLAHDLSLFDQLRAIKETPRSYCDDKEDEFLTILNHPAIPKLNERFNIRKFHYSVMEFIEGESLEDRVKKMSGGLTEAKVLAYASQICDVLNYIHSQKVVHRDLKPENIIIRKDGSISLIDFGISKQYVAGQGTRQLARAASYNYSSPEQYQAGKGNTDYKSDIYSFGAILYYLSTGIEPIDALSRNAGKDISPLPRTLNSRISSNLERVIVKAMNMKKNNRFKNIKEMEQALIGNGKTSAKRVCTKCKSLVESGINFCPNCGYSTKPVKPTSASSVFTFRSNKKASSIQKLVQTCYQEWSDAKWHLYRGDFEKWLNSVKNGKSLAKKAAPIRKNQSDQHLGLNEFLMSSGYGKSPKIFVHQTKIELGKTIKGYTKNVVLSITNKGQGYLNGTVNTKAKWITINQKTFSCLGKRQTRITLSIDTNKLTEKKDVKATININSNGGKITIPVSISVAVSSTYAKQAAISSVKIDVTKGKVVTKELSLTNSSSKKKVTSLTNWIKVKSTSLKQGKQKIVLTLSAQKLNIGRHKGKISIGTGKNAQNIEIVLNVTSSKSKNKFFLFKTILLTMFVVLIIRYLGPTANFTISTPWVIATMGLLFGIISANYGEVGFILGLVIGACLGALMNTVSYFVFPYVNENIVLPAAKLLPIANLTQVSYCIWGLLAVLVGGLVVIFLKMIKA